VQLYLDQIAPLKKDSLHRCLGIEDVAREWIESLEDGKRRKKVDDTERVEMSVRAEFKRSLIKSQRV
jgi:hypothetical protein